MTAPFSWLPFVSLRSITSHLKVDACRVDSGGPLDEIARDRAIAILASGDHSSLNDRKHKRSLAPELTDPLCDPRGQGGLEASTAKLPVDESRQRIAITPSRRRSAKRLIVVADNLIDDAFLWGSA